MQRFRVPVSNRRGSQMVEAGVVLPMLILTIMLMLRLFVFYLDIINTSVKEHMKVLEAWDNYNGSAMRVYESEASVYMVKGGVLGFTVAKDIKSRAYFFNEDNLVRAGESID